MEGVKRSSSGEVRVMKEVKSKRLPTNQRILLEI